MHRVTLTRYLVEQQRNKDIVSAELRLLIEVVDRKSTRLNSSHT